MQIILSPEEAQVIRRMGARINGSIGGSAKSKNKTKAVRRNGKLARKAKARLAVAA